MSPDYLRSNLLAWIAGALVLTATHSFAVEGPSFDCSHGVRQTLAVILCADNEAAQADWSMNSAYWALFTDDREETTFNRYVSQRCGLPRLETEQERAGRVFIQQMGRVLGTPGLPLPVSRPLTDQHVRCVINAFRNRATALRGRLRGDALAEADLSPEEHIEVQTALLRKGFLQNRIRNYGASADGQFGPNTRAAIRDFQRSIGASETGFLSQDQRTVLIESPEEKQARAERAAAEERERLKAIEVQKQLEQLAKQQAQEREKSG